jgi:ATP-dependent DNA ligase
VLVDAPEMKANFAADDAGAISTLGVGQTSQNSLINAQNGAVPSLISYPARPIQGGKLDRAPKKIGLWYAEPKYNGWRAVVHCPSGTMWNRHGGRLSIAGEFDAALRELKKLSERGLVWADCEPMERRHNVGRRSLIVLDWIPYLGSPTYEERRAFLEPLLPLERMSLCEGTMPEDSVLLAPSIAETNGQALQLYRSLEAINRSVLADVFEGVVMKHSRSLQLV